jgi:hypothetical protein
VLGQAMHLGWPSGISSCVLGINSTLPIFGISALTADIDHRAYLAASWQASLQPRPIFNPQVERARAGLAGSSVAPITTVTPAPGTGERPARKGSHLNRAGRMPMVGREWACPGGHAPGPTAPGCRIAADGASPPDTSCLASGTLTPEPGTESHQPVIRKDPGHCQHTFSFLPAIPAIMELHKGKDPT